MIFYTAFDPVFQTLKNVDWRAMGSRTAAAARIAYIVTQLAAMAVVMVAEITYEHRQQIRNFAVMAVASAVVTAEAVYKAGMATGNWVERIGSASVETLDKLPEGVAPVAPIAAPAIAVTKSAATALKDWLQFDSDVAEDVEQTGGEISGSNLCGAWMN